MSERIENDDELSAALRSLPADFAPERDLRPGIHAALDRRARERAERAVRVRVLRGLRWPMAAAAVLLIALSSVATWVIVGKAARGVATSRVETPGDFRLAELRDAESRYAAAIADLRRSLDEAAVAGALTANTRGLLVHNLDVIDRALAEARAALAEDPANPDLPRVILAAWERKLDLLRQAQSSIG